ncbi:hypothetical protein [Streptomyces massasporeus]|uniref:hypothetical protein n=1 Tax=Streptomyces massasporeus TaxID=67324 RepID=UPI0038110000
MTTQTAAAGREAPARRAVGRTEGTTALSGRPTEAHQPTADGRALLCDRGISTPSVLAAVIALNLLFGWLLAQRRSATARPLRQAAPGGTVRTQAPAVVPARRANAVPGVARSRARVLPRPRRRLEARPRVRLRPGTSPQAVLTAPCGAPGKAEESAAPCGAHTRLHVSAAPHRAPHVR